MKNTKLIIAIGIAVVAAAGVLAWQMQSGSRGDSDGKDKTTITSTSTEEREDVDTSVPAKNTDTGEEHLPAHESAVEMFNLINAHRQTEGLLPYAYSKTLEDGANLKLQDMLTKSYYGDTPDGVSVAEFAAQAGYTFASDADVKMTIACGKTTVEEKFQSFLGPKAPAYREKVESLTFEEVGIITGMIQCPAPVNELSEVIVILFGNPA